MKEYSEKDNPLSGFYYKPLPTVLIKDNFVKGDYFSYEDWMLEYTNLSQHFLNLSGGEQYHKPETQANRECDCISPSYEMDFKRLIASSFMYGKALTSNQITKNINGMISESGPEREISVKCYMIEKICRFIEPIEYEKPELIKDLEIRNCVHDVIKIIKTKKNLCCLFPILVENDNNEKIISLENSILYTNLCFRDLFKYRDKINPGYDSYICFFYGDYYIITAFNGENFIYIEKIERTNSKTYLKAREDSGYPFCML